MDLSLTPQTPPSAASVAEDLPIPPPDLTRAERLLDAYRQYDLAYQATPQVSAASLKLARARLELAVLLLHADGEEGELPAVVLAQLGREAKTVFARTPTSSP